jgi:hypothetical protein
MMLWLKLSRAFFVFGKANFLFLTTKPNYEDDDDLVLALWDLFDAPQLSSGGCLVPPGARSATQKDTVSGKSSSKGIVTIEQGRVGGVNIGQRMRNPVFLLFHYEQQHF